jgi:hypothetical protein
MNQQLFLDEDWSYLLTFLPPRSTLERSAADFGAIRRVREISSASTLLRLMMAYGFCGMSLRRTAAWAGEAGLATISDVSLLDRFRNGADWLGHVLALKLADHASYVPDVAPGFRVRLIDATSITRVGGKGTDWRVHLTLNLSRLNIDQVELTDSSGGERLSRFKFNPGELAVGDRGYAHKNGVESVVRSGADFLVRMAWSNLPLLTPDGQPVDVLDYCRQVAGMLPVEFPVRIRDSRIGPVRLLIIRKSAAAATESRRKVQLEATKKKRAVDLRTLEACNYIILLTSAASERLRAEQAFELYRLRWQIEITFKRLKSLVHLDQLPAKNAALAQVILRAKLLAALLIDDYTDRYLSFSPWGYPIPPEEPAALTLAHH